MMQKDLVHSAVVFLIGFSATTAGLLAATSSVLAANNEFARLLKSPGSNESDLVEQFDLDGDGVLNKTERTAARRFLRAAAVDATLKSFDRKDGDKDGKLSSEEVGGGWRNPLRGADANGDGFVDKEEAAGAAFREKVEQNFALHPDAEVVPPRNSNNSGSGLYDTGVLRTFFLEFEDDEWLGEMHDFYHTGLDVPSDLIVDGDLIRGVGVRYRGNSSFFLMEPDKKRSLNLSINHSEKGKNLYGYNTLNLHNGAEDPTFIREVLYLRICRDYMPAFRANFAKVVINGESWGIYLNVQQYNSDFVDEWFGSRKGARWKVGGGSGKKGLSYEGDDVSAYQGYSLKTDDAPETALTDLINLCRVLSTTEDGQLEAALKPIFNIDGALWSLALENVFVDEGYFIRTSDYDIFQDKNRRFHLLQHDGNEVFNIPHGPGLPRGFDATKLEPLHNIDNKDYAVVNRLLNIPHLRARYLAHVRTILDDWFEWEHLEPVIAGYRALIGDEIRKDVRKLYGTEDYEKGVLETVNNGGVLGIKEFVDKRREFLVNHELLVGSAPEIESVEIRSTEEWGGPITVTAKLGMKETANWAGLYWSSKRNAPYDRVPMFDDGKHGDGEAGDGVFAGEIPPQKQGSRFQYYVEARSGGDKIVSAFYPAKAEAGALTHIVK